jgi:hypothetical protein
LGCILFEMLTARLPFYSANPMDLVRQQVKKQMTFPQISELQITPSAETLIRWVTVLQASVYVITQYNSFLHFLDDVYGISCFWKTGRTDHKNCNKHWVVVIPCFFAHQ